MNLKERQSLLLKILIEYNNKISLEELISKLQISLKTLKNDIKLINDIISPFASEIIIEKNKVHFKTRHKQSYWLNVLALNQQLSTTELIKATLLITPNYITSYDLANMCFTSKSNVEKIIGNLVWKHCLVKAVRNRGYIVTSSKEDKMKEFWSLIYNYIDPLNYELTTKRILSKIFPIEDQKYGQAIDETKALIIKYDIKHNDIIMFNFAISLIGKHIESLKLSESNLETLFNLQNIQTRKKEIAEIVNEFLLVNNISNVDPKTYTLLVNHLDVLLKNNYIIEKQKLSTKLEEIKERFNYAYVLANSLIGELKKRFSFNVCEIELLYITVYIQTIINKNLAVIRPVVIVVSEYSDSIANYLAIRIQEQLPSKYVVKTMPLTDFQNYSVTNEIIVSTLKNIERINYLQISPFPSDEDVFKVIKIIKKREISQQFDELFKLEIKRLVHPDNLIKQMAQDFVKYKLADQKYLESVISRFKQKLAVINNTIILHGNSKHAFKNQILIYNLEQPMKYNGEIIKVIIILLLNESNSEYFSNISKNLYRFINDQEFAQALSSDISLQKINWYLKGNYFT